MDLFLLYQAIIVTVISAINHCCCLGPKAQLNMHIENAYTLRETNGKYYRIKISLYQEIRVK
jgi:hypothetical protein